MVSTSAVATQEVASVGGRSLMPETNALKNDIIWSIGEAERLKGSPPTTPEQAVVFFKHITKEHSFAILNCFVQNLYREDHYYADKGFLLWSLNGPDGTEERKTFEKFSERFLRLYPSYMLDKNMRIVAKPDTAVVNLKQLIYLLKSKSENLWERCRWMFDPDHFRFLDGEENPSQRVALCSFPRSGNTFLRRYIELLTGIVTGSDNTLHLNIGL